MLHPDGTGEFPDFRVLLSGSGYHRIVRLMRAGNVPRRNHSRCSEDVLLLIVEEDVGTTRLEDRRFLESAHEMRFVGRSSPRS